MSSIWCLWSVRMVNLQRYGKSWEFQRNEFQNSKMENFDQFWFERDWGCFWSCEIMYWLATGLSIYREKVWGQGLIRFASCGVMAWLRCNLWFLEKSKFQCIVPCLLELLDTLNMFLWVFRLSVCRWNKCEAQGELTIT